MATKPVLCLSRAQPQRSWGACADDVPTSASWLATRVARYVALRVSTSVKLHQAQRLDVGMWSIDGFPLPSDERAGEGDGRPIAGSQSRIPFSRRPTAC